MTGERPDVPQRPMHRHFEPWRRVQLVGVAHISNLLQVLFHLRTLIADKAPVVIRRIFVGAATATQLRLALRRALLVGLGSSVLREERSVRLVAGGVTM